MDDASFVLELGADFSEGPIDEPGELFVFTRTRSTPPAAAGNRSDVARVDLDRRCIVELLPIEGSAAGLVISPAHRMLVLPSLEEGPRIMGFDGAFLSSLDASQTARGFSECDVRASDGVVALSSEEEACLWRWREKTLEVLSSFGSGVAFGADDAVFFMRGSSELWCWREGKSERLLRATSTAVGFEPSDSWRSRVQVSRDGRFVLAFVAGARQREVKLAGVLFDLHSRRVVQLPWLHPYSFAWLR